jgi:hypothetical protein
MKYLVIALVLVLATSAFGLEKKAYQLKDDFGMEPQYDGALQYYYYIPCPTYSWFWAYTGWVPGEVIGSTFCIGDQGTGGWAPLDPLNCNTLEQFRILDFAGYGTVYPGLFTVEFDLWCGDGAYHLWNSGPYETGFAWNYIPVVPPVCFTECLGYGSVCCDPATLPILITATHTGTNGVYPAWGMDNISTGIEVGCVFHDLGCLPAVYPRTSPCTPGGVHGGYISDGITWYTPAIGFADGRDTTPDASQFGFIELAWRVYIICEGPTATEPSTWGNIKSMYR